MPQYLSPGVYVEELDGGARPIEGVGTAVAAFVGLAQRGPFNEPTLVTNWTQFVTAFGEFVEGSYLAHSVYGYFQNGGGIAYIVRIGSDSEGAQPAARGELGAGDGKQLPYKVNALEAGAAGNDLTVEIQHPEGEGAADDQFTIVVKKGNKVEETFPDLSTKKGKQNAAQVVNQTSKLIRTRGVHLRRRPRASGQGQRSACRAAAPRPLRLASRPATTSATWPTAPASVPSRPSTRSPCCRSRPHRRLRAGPHQRRGLPGRAAGHDQPLRVHG